MFDDNMRRRHHRPWFFEDEHGDAVTVNQERHVEEALCPFWGSWVSRPESIEKEDCGSNNMMPNYAPPTYQSNSYRVQDP